jgi:hypothetical protein
MRYVCTAEEKAAGANCRHLILCPMAGASGDEIEFVAMMRDLCAIRGSSGGPYFQFSVK